MVLRCGLKIPSQGELFGITKISVWLCGLYYGADHVLKSSRALCSRVSSFLLELWSPRLGKRELVCVLLVHLFVCFVRVSFCHFLFLLVSGVGCGLWLWHSLDFSINFFAEWCRTVIPSAGFFNSHPTTIIDSFSCILFLRQFYLSLNMR